MRSVVSLFSVVLFAVTSAPVCGWADEGGGPGVERVSARLTPEGLGGVARGGRFSLPKFRIFDGEGRQVFEMNGFVPALFKSQVQRALAEPEPLEGEHTLKRELAAVVDASGGPLPELPDSDFTLVEYWAEWCAPCKLLGKQLEEIFAAGTEHRLTLLTVEADPEKLLGAQPGAEPAVRPVNVVDVAALDPDLVRKLQSPDLDPKERQALMARVVEAGALKRLDPDRLSPEQLAKLKGGALTPEELQEIIEQAGIE